MKKISSENSQKQLKVHNQKTNSIRLLEGYSFGGQVNVVFKNP